MNQDAFFPDESERYLMSPADADVVTTTTKLLWKIVRSHLATSKQLEVMARMLQIFEAYPALGSDVYLQLLITGPRRMFGDHEIHHWWNIEVEDRILSVSSQGYFHRPETGGDTFTSMAWRAMPGLVAEHNDYLETLGVVDDAQPFASEVDGIDFADDGYSLTVFEHGDELEDEAEDGEEEEDADGFVGLNESSCSNPSDQITLNEAVDILESAGVECVWANSQLTELHSIDLNEISIADTAFLIFQFIPTLHTLEARNTNFSDQSLFFISHLVSLEWLCLRRTAVTDEGLQYLGALTSLNHLDLRGTRITGPGLMHLRRLVNLRELCVQGFQHNDPWLGMLRNELPRCEILS